MFNKILNSIIKTIAVIKYKTALFDFYLLYSFTSVSQFLINLSFWLFRRQVAIVVAFTDSYHFKFSILTSTCHQQETQTYGVPF